MNTCISFNHNCQRSEQLKYPSVNGWRNKLQFLHLVNYSVIIRKLSMKPLINMKEFIMLIVELFSHSVTSNSLWPHGLQHIRLPCPSLSPEVCSNAHAHWVDDVIQPFCWENYPSIPPYCWAEVNLRKATYCMIQTLWYIEKYKTTEKTGRSKLPWGLREWIERWIGRT